MKTGNALLEASDDGMVPCAPEHVWVCGACGKTSPTRWGFSVEGATPGWDESCMLHAVLCHREKKDDVWQAVER